MSTHTTKYGNCQACLEDDDLIVLPCEHASYCSGCTITEFSLIREVTRPRCPECSTPVSLEAVKSVLPESLYADLEAKLIEFEVPGPLRLYCPNLACTKYIGSSKLVDSSSTDSQVQCPHCAAKICKCKRLVHDGECIDEFKETKKAANPANSKQCSQCGNLVERKSACQHMTCDCGHQFCVLCGADWSVCQGTCPGSTADANWNHGERTESIRDLLNRLLVILVMGREYLARLDPRPVNGIRVFVELVIDFAQIDLDDLDRQVLFDDMAALNAIEARIQNRNFPARPERDETYQANQQTLESHIFTPLRQFATADFLMEEPYAIRAIRDMWEETDPEEREIGVTVIRRILESSLQDR